MPELRPVIELVKVPVPVPSVVLLSLVVGLADVLQHTPLAVTEAPPSEVTFPPLDALFWVIDDTGVVLTVRDVVSVATAAPKFTLGLVMAIFPSVMESPLSTIFDLT